MNQSHHQSQGDCNIITQELAEEDGVAVNGDVNMLFASNFPIMNTHQSTYQMVSVQQLTPGRNYSQQKAIVSHQKRTNEKRNTEKAFNPKIAEFKSYSKEIYSEEEPELYYLTTSEKVFGFMFYQANRVKKKNKKKSGFFDKTDFERTLTYTDDDFRDIIGEPTINQYICAIRKYAEVQYNAGLVKYKKEDIMITALRDLIKGVNNRSERVLKKQFKERITDDF